MTQHLDHVKLATLVLDSTTALALSALMEPIVLEATALVNLVWDVLAVLLLQESVRRVTQVMDFNQTVHALSALEAPFQLEGLSLANRVLGAQTVQQSMATAQHAKPASDSTTARARTVQLELSLGKGQLLPAKTAAQGAPLALRLQATAVAVKQLSA